MPGGCRSRAVVRLCRVQGISRVAAGQKEKLELEGYEGIVRGRVYHPFGFPANK